MKNNRRDSVWLDICMKINPNISYSLSNKNIKDKRELFYKYLIKLERVSSLINESNFKKYAFVYYKKYVIEKDNIKDSVVKKIKERELYNNGHIINESSIRDGIIENQKNSLNSILNFLLKQEKYNIFEKYFLFQGLIRLKEEKNSEIKFINRDRTTIAPFISIDEEALDYVINMVNNYVDTGFIPSVSIKSALKEGNFKALYNYSVSELRKSNNTETDGVWKKYNKGEDYKELFFDLDNKYTGWCTERDELTCKNQMSSGDFYVYYTKNIDNIYSIPRIAIRMKDSEIYEIRGILKNQEVEPELLDILKSKLNELPFSKRNMKKFKDMKMVELIYKKAKENISLDEEELRFIYQVDSPIYSFGYIDNPKIHEILSTRNYKDDLSKIFNLDKKYIKDNVNEVNDDTVIFIGELNIDEIEETSKLNSIKYVFGNINSRRKKVDFEELELVVGSLNLPNTKSFSARKLKRINEYCNLMYLNDASDLVSLEYIGKDAAFSSLYESYGLDNLKYVMGDLDFSELVDARNLTSLVEINGEANFYSLGSSSGLNNLKYINGRAIFSSLNSASSLTSLTFINGSAHFEKLISSCGLKNLEYICDSAYFNRLIYPIFPSLKNIYGSGIFPNIETYSFIDNLDYVGSDLYLKKEFESDLKDYHKKNLKLVFE